MARAAWTAAAVVLVCATATWAQATPAGAGSTATAQSQPASQAAGPSVGVESPKLRLADDNSPTASHNEKPASPVWQMLSSVLVVLALGMLALLAMKKWGPRMGMSAGRSGKRVKVLETTYLGQRKSVHLVEVGKKKFLLAGSSSGLTLLAEVTDAFEDGQEEKG